MFNMKKTGVYILFLVGLACVFVPFSDNLVHKYFQIVGVCLVMFSLYFISSKLTSKDTSKDTSRDQNLKF